MKANWRRTPICGAGFPAPRLGGVQRIYPARGIGRTLEATGYAVAGVDKDRLIRQLPPCINSFVKSWVMRCRCEHRAGRAPGAGGYLVSTQAGAVMHPAFESYRRDGTTF